MITLFIRVKWTTRLASDNTWARGRLKHTSSRREQIGALLACPPDWAQGSPLLCTECGLLLPAWRAIELIVWILFSRLILAKIRVWQLTTARSHCWVCVTSSWSVLHSSAFLPQSKVCSVQTRLVSGKVEALVTRLLPSPLSSKMDSNRT